MIKKPLRSLVVGSFLAALLTLPALPDAVDYPPSWSPPTAEEAEERLASLSFREFVEEAFRLDLLHQPQGITYHGLTARLGVRNDRLQSYSLETEREMKAIADLILNQLRRFDRETLSPRDRVTYDVCTTRWELGFTDSETELFGYPLHPGLNSPDQTLYRHLLEVHSLQTYEDVVDYIARLYQVSTVVETMVERFERWMADGGRMPKSLLEETVDAIDKLWTYNAYDHPLYRRFEDEVAAIASISEDEYEMYAADAYHAVHTVANRAFRTLSKALASYASTMLRPFDPVPQSCTEGIYAEALAYKLGYSASPAEVHQVALAEVERIIGEIELLAPTFGRDVGIPHMHVVRLALVEAGRLYGNDALAAFETAVAFAEARCGDAFDWMPLDPVGIAATAAAVPHYQPPSLGGTTDGVYRIPITYGFPAALIPSTTYHEVMPGHHLQVAWTQREPLPLIQQGAFIVGFSEGWATYAEELARELGWYDDDPAGLVGHLYNQLWQTALVVVETGIFALEWDFDQIAAYLSETISYSRAEAWDMYIQLQSEPVFFPPYVYGRVKLLALRETVRAAQGDAFTLAGFHDLVLQNGGIPLSALERFVLDSLTKAADETEQ
ncbi:DUF885 domain-containing protein [Candidatus Bipolaricaulota bacterium]